MNGNASAQEHAVSNAKEFGWHVFRIAIGHNTDLCDGGTANCKTVNPIGAHWITSNDPEVVAAWDWSAANAYGIDCGRSGLYVVDVDPSGEWADESTRIHGTGRGRHYLYEDLIGLPSGQHVWPHVDTRGTGGMVIGPGSWHPHGAYTVVQDVPPAVLPAKVLATVSTPKAGVTGTYDGPEYADLTPEQKAQADQHVEVTIFDLSVRLAEATAWDEESKDHKGRGWERLAADAAWSLMCLALCPWTGLDLDTAATEYDRILPTVIAANEKCRGKWTTGRIALAEDAKVRLPPWAAPIGGIESGSGWAPVDLAATVAGLLNGTITRPEPTIGDFDGGYLFYAGRINSVHGDSTAGKTWTALVTCQQELAKGETVVYADLEDSAEGTVSRLLVDLGVPADAVSARFIYLHPDEPLSKASALGLTALLTARQPSLVVVDSTGEALAIEGANPNADEEVARWFRMLPRLAVRCGAAVLLLDHATKAGDNDLWPIGSQRKRAAVSGAAYLQRVVVPFGKGQDGKAVLICAKDRHGNYPLRRRVAALAVTNGVIYLKDETGSVQGDFRPTGLMERVSIVLEAAPQPMSSTAVEKVVIAKAVNVRTALAALVTDGYVSRAAGPHRSSLHTSLKPYRED